MKIKIGICLFIPALFALVFTIFMSPSAPYASSLEAVNKSPSFTYLLGTDELGRDLFSRVIQGTTISCIIGFFAFLLDIIIGTLWGALSAALYPSFFSTILRKIAEALYSVPYLLVVIFITTFTGSGIIPLCISMICMSWIQVSRMIEQLILEALHSDYALAAKIIGVPKRTIILKHIMPNIYLPILAASLMSIPSAIFSEAFLSFLGVGIQPPVASLGTLINNAIPSISFYPLRLICPAFMITSIIISITCIADGLIEKIEAKKRSHE